jgi:transposase-like protein
VDPIVTPTSSTSLKRKQYSGQFKSKVLAVATNVGNISATARFFGVDESNIRAWKKSRPHSIAQDDDSADDSTSELATVRELAEQILESVRRKSQVHFPEVEQKLLQWFTIQRTKENPVSLKMIREEALSIFAKTNKDTQKLFRASTGWVYGFLSRNKITKRKATHISQKLPEEFSSKVVSFFKDVDEKRKKLLKDKNTVSVLIGEPSISNVFFADLFLFKVIWMRFLCIMT